MARPKPLHPFPLTLGHLRGALLDVDSFYVLRSEKAITHSQQGGPLDTRLVSAEESTATTLHTFVAYNSHQVLVDALNGIKKQLTDGTFNAGIRALDIASAALDAVDVLSETARAELYEESGEVRQ